MIDTRAPDAASASRLGRALRDTWPFFVIVTLFVGIGYASQIETVGASHGPGQALLFTLATLATAALYWLSPLLVVDRPRLWVFLAAQLALAVVIGLLTSGHWLVLALDGCLMGIVAAALWTSWRAVALALSVCVAVMLATVASSWGVQALWDTLPAFGLISVLVVVYVLLFIRQLHAREAAQHLLEELKIAHRRLEQHAEHLEELTLTRERERMGRELHDTLAQGLVGLIMQLEAIDGQLERGDEARAREVVAAAALRARTSLREARRAIGALRSSALDDGGLGEAIAREVAEFVDSTGVACDYESRGDGLDIDPDAAQQILRIVQEGLSNIARHAAADRARVALDSAAAELRVVIEDDGVGFVRDGPPRGFGLVGLQERAEQLGAELSLDSVPGKGTKIELVVRR